MELVIKIKPCTTLAQAEELFDELTENESFMDLIEDIKLTPGGEMV